MTCGALHGAIQVMNEIKCLLLDEEQGKAQGDLASCCNPVVTALCACLGCSALQCRIQHDREAVVVMRHCMPMAHPQGRQSWFCTSCVLLLWWVEGVGRSFDSHFCTVFSPLWAEEVVAEHIRHMPPACTATLSPFQPLIPSRLTGCV